MEFQKKLKTPAGTAFLASVAIGFVTHLFALVNVIHNYDSVLRLPYDYGSGIPHGRWGLQLLGELAQRLGGNTNLPLFNGLLFLLLVGLSVALLIDLFDVKDRKSAALIGMLFAVFPASASILIHRYAAVYYGISMLLAVAAVWVLGKNKLAPVLSVLCITLSLGIYQAFVPITISAFVLLMLQRVLRQEGSFWEIVKQGLFYCALLLAGLALYYLIQELAMKITGVGLVEYQGVSDMGRLELKHIPKLVKNAIYLVVMLPMKNYCGLTDTPFLRLGYALLGGLAVLMIGYILIVKVKKPLMVILGAVLSGLFLLSVNFIYVMCPDGLVYTLMVYPLAMLFCVPAVAYECLPKEEGKKQLKKITCKLIAVGMAVLIGSYAYLANTNYTAMYYADQQVKNYMNSLVVQVRMTEGYDSGKEWAFIGRISDPDLFFTWQPLMTYGGFTGTNDLLACHSTFSWIRYYTGYALKYADDARAAELAQLEEVKAMPCWPAEGSIKVIGDTVVIKCVEGIPEPFLASAI